MRDLNATDNRPYVLVPFARPADADELAAFIRTNIGEATLTAVVDKAGSNVGVLFERPEPLVLIVLSPLMAAAEALILLDPLLPGHGARDVYLATLDGRGLVDRTAGILRGRWGQIAAGQAGMAEIAAMRDGVWTGVEEWAVDEALTNALAGEAA